MGIHPVEMGDVWVENYSEKHQRKFWKHAKSGMVTWSKPANVHETKFGKAEGNKEKGENGENIEGGGKRPSESSHSEKDEAPAVPQNIPKVQPGFTSILQAKELKEAKEAEEDAKESNRGKWEARLVLQYLRKLSSIKISYLMKVEKGTAGATRKQDEYVRPSFFSSSSRYIAVDFSGPKDTWGVYGHRSESNAHKIVADKRICFMKDVTLLEHEREPESLVRICMGRQVCKLSPIPHSPYVATLWNDAIRAGIELQKFSTEQIQIGRERLVEELNRPSNFVRHSSFRSDNSNSTMDKNNDSEGRMSDMSANGLARISLSKTGGGGPSNGKPKRASMSAGAQGGMFGYGHSGVQSAENGLSKKGSKGSMSERPTSDLHILDKSKDDAVSKAAPV
jgi:hypothetical protein